MNTKTSAAAATTLLNADDPLIDMHFITAYTNMTDKWFYSKRAVRTVLTK